MKIDRKAFWFAIGCMAAFMAMVAVGINLLTQLPNVATITTSDAYAHVNILLIVLLALAFFVNSGVFIYLGQAARRKKEVPSPLYPPIIVESLTLLVIFGLSALSGLAREHDGLRTPLGAAWIRTPAVQILQVALIYIGLLTAVCWFLAIMLRAQGLKQGRINMLYAEVVAVGVGFMLSAVWL